MKLSTYLGLQNRSEVISIVGGGGKTSTMFRLGKELKSNNVLLTTTTKILKPPVSDDYKLYIEKNIDLLLRKIKDDGYDKTIICGSSSPEGERKLIGCSEDFLFQLKDHFKHTIIEADGSAGKPIKAPANHEPVIVGFTSIYIGIIGLDSYGKKATPEHVHRAELLAKLRNKPESAPIEVEDYIKLINSPLGLFKDAPQMCRKIVLFNKADLLEKKLRTHLFNKISQNIPSTMGLVFNSYKSEDSVLLYK